MCECVLAHLCACFVIEVEREHMSHTDQFLLPRYRCMYDGFRSFMACMVCVIKHSRFVCAGFFVRTCASRSPIDIPIRSNVVAFPS